MIETNLNYSLIKAVVISWQCVLLRELLGEELIATK